MRAERNQIRTRRENQRRRKIQYVIIIGIFAICIIAGAIFFLFSGELGNITGIGSTELTAVTEKDDYLDDSKEYKVYNSGYANLSIPYPAGYERENESANKIKLTKGTSEIYIEIGDTKAGEDTMSDKLTDFLAQFKYRLKHENYLDTYYRYEDQEETTSDSLLKDINNKKEKRIGQEYGKLRLANYLGEYSTQTAYERRYYLRKNGTDLMITIMSESENKDTAGKEINYIVQHLKTYKESPKKKTGTVSGISFSLPNTFESETLDSSTYGSNKAYHVSTTSSSSIAGTFIYIYDVSDDFSLDSDYDGGFMEFATEYPAETDVMDNVSSGGSISESDTGFLVTKIRKSTKIKDAYYDDIVICRTASDGSILLEDGKSYTVEAFTVKTEDGMKLVTVGYLTDKADDVINQISLSLSK